MSLLNDHMNLPNYYKRVKIESQSSDGNTYLTPSVILILSPFSEVLPLLGHLESLHSEFEVFPSWTVAKNF